MKNTYIKRFIDEKLKLYLETFGAVYIKGPKWCGKTTTALQFSNSFIKLQDEDMRDSYLAAADTQLSLLLRGANPRLIDEWQMIPSLWNAIRNEIDEKNTEGLYILTGSKVPTDDKYRHSGAGRFRVLFMYPMTLSESGDSANNISLSAILNGTQIFDNQESKLSVEDLGYCLCRGGWPANIGLPYQKCALKISSYLDLIYESNDLELKKYAKKVDVARNIVKSYSRNVSQLSDTNTIYEDTMKDDHNISITQFYDYLNALKNTYLIEDVEAWNPNIRSKTAIRSKTKKELIDPSIAAYYLGLTPSNLIDNFTTFGFLFESLCIRDLKVYANALGGRIYYYRDSSQLEADAVMVLDDGRYGLIEIKLGSMEIEKAAQNFAKLESLIEKANYRKPSFKLILTGGKFAYKKACVLDDKTFDDIYVVPMGCLTL